MNDFHEMLVNRHSIRKYTAEPLDADQVRLILEAALMAPSSKSGRPWQFVVVEDKDMLVRLGDCKPAYATSVANAPLAIVVCADPASTDTWVEDCSIAAAFMQLQAEALGLGSCWVEVHNRQAADGTPSDDVVRELLGIPDNFTPLCIISVGHKDEVRRPVDPAKLKWEKIHIGSWNAAQAD